MSKGMIYAAILVTTFVLWICTNTNEPDAKRVLHASGFTQVKTDSHYQWFMCGTGDWSSTGFTANGPSGISTSGVVCCGLIVKGCTVRQ